MCKFPRCYLRLSPLIALPAPSMAPGVKVSWPCTLTCVGEPGVEKLASMIHRVLPHGNMNLGAWCHTTDIRPTVLLISSEAGGW